MATSEPALPAVFRRATARRAGLTDRQIDRLLASGRWRSLRQGFLTAVRQDPEVALDLHTAAVLSSQEREVVLSHAHAARAYGLPRPLQGWGPLTLTATRGPTRYRPDVRILVARLVEDELRVTGSFLMTSGPRTVVDCLRSLPPADGLAIADAALRAGICSPTGLGSALDRAAGRPNVAVARRTAALVEPRRESPLESWSALAFAAEGVPAPCWQVDVLDEQGRFVARVDAWWPEGVAGESDGRAKYLLAAEERGGADAARLARVLHEEREREQRLRRLGVDVVRWGARDVLQPDRARALAEHLRARLAAAGRQAPFTGRVR